MELDVWAVALMLAAAVFGLLGLVYLINLLGFVIRGGGLTLIEAVVKIVIIVALGAAAWGLLTLAGVL